MNREDKEIQNYFKELEDIEGHYEFQALLESWKEKALSDEKAIWFFFKELIHDLVQDSNLWNTKSNLSVGIFYILIDINNIKAYSLAKWFIQNCKEDTPSGAIELISTLFPSFNLIDVKEFFHYLNSKNKAQSAIGFLTLFNLAMERKLEIEEEKNLFEIAKTYKNDYYYVAHISELLQFRFHNLSSKEESEKIDIQLVG